MADLKETRTQQSLDRDDLSDAGTERAEVETLNEEDRLPAYPDDEAGPSTAAETQRPPEKAPHISGPTTAAPFSLPTGDHASGPTASAPFNFPTGDLPSYESAVEIKRPLAIPQISPASDAPFLAAYPTDLLSYGIPAESWYSFVDTVSAFVSAKVSKQAVHHASDIAGRMGDFHKQYVNNVKQGFKDIGKSAKHFNPFGVVGGALGLTFGTVGHAVGTVFNTTSSLAQKPKTPRERATVYLAAANKDWFHGRGLHALLLTTTELASVLRISPQQIVTPPGGQEDSDPAAQVASLRQWIGDVQVKPNGSDFETREQSAAAEKPVAGSSRLTPSSSVQRSDASRRSSSAGKRPWPAQLQFSFGTLWLVIMQEKKVQEMAVDEKRYPMAQDGSRGY